MAKTPTLASIIPLINSYHLAALTRQEVGPDRIRHTADVIAQGRARTTLVRWECLDRLNNVTPRGAAVLKAFNRG